MRPDLEQCISAIYRKGFPVGIVTNGYMLTPRRLQSLLDSGLHSLAMSLDGFEEDHNWMRGNGHSFQRASEALDVLALAGSQGFVYDVVTCVNQRNYQRLCEFRDYLISKGLEKWRLFSIFPVGRAAQHAELKLTAQQYKGLMDFIVETRREGKISASYGCEGFLGGYEGEVRNHFYHCLAGVTVGSVLADGSISACASIRANYSQGNIKTDDFMEVWNQRFQPYRDRSWMKKDECEHCKYFRYCKGNGMHLRDENGRLLFCHLNRIKEAEKNENK